MNTGTYYENLASMYLTYLCDYWDECYMQSFDGAIEE